MLIDKLKIHGLDKWTFKWIDKWLNCSSRGCDQWHEVQVMTSHLWCMPGLILDPVLFNIFINNLDDGSDLNKFEGATELGGVIDRPDGCALSQLDLNRLEKWSHRNLIFNKKRCQVLHLVSNNPRHQYKLGIKWMESTFAEKDLEVLVNKLNMNQ